MKALMAFGLHRSNHVRQRLCQMQKNSNRDLDQMFGSDAAVWNLSKLV